MENRVKYADIFRFFGEVAIGLVLIVGPVMWMELGGFFKSAPENHNHYRWQSLESFQDSIDIDVLILGNSHAFTGINPKQLSASLGMTSFVLANNGIVAKDAYWNLKEALELCSPKLILLETSLINHKQTQTGDLATLISSIRTSEAKLNPKFKLATTWDVFTLDELIYPWSSVLLNHHILVEEPELVLTNVFGYVSKIPEELKTFRSAEKLYLGRHVKYNEGISQANLAEYDSLGPVVTDENASVSEENAMYAKRIIDLARSTGTEIAFVTLPLFDRHMPDSIAAARSDALEQLALQDHVPLLDLQKHSMALVPEFFQATRHYNQHMTLLGSMKASQVISDWIDAEFRGAFLRPGRVGETAWHRLFEAEEGYLSYHPASKENPSVKYLLQNVMTPQMTVDEIVFFRVNNTLRKNLDCFIKIKPTEIRDQRAKCDMLELDLLVLDEQGVSKRLLVKLQRDTLLRSDEYWIYRSPIPNVQVKQLYALQIK
tara:strand:+ start:3729 stop:5195 length:1467 start_codon:yes stop_codon:yes gene_type:complete